MFALTSGMLLVLRLGVWCSAAPSSLQAALSELHDWVRLSVRAGADVVVLTEWFCCHPFEAHIELLSVYCQLRLLVVLRLSAFAQHTVLACT